VTSTVSKIRVRRSNRGLESQAGKFSAANIYMANKSECATVLETRLQVAKTLCCPQPSGGQSALRITSSLHFRDSRAFRRESESATAAIAPVVRVQLDSIETACLRAAFRMRSS